MNASESDIKALLEAGNVEEELDAVMEASAYDFGFYTQVQGTTEDGDPTFVNVAVAYDDGDWSIDADNLARVKAGYNTVSNEDGSAAIGGTGGDFVELGEAEAGSVNFAMGNGGNDTYQVDAGDSGIINELGNIDWTVGGMGSDSDAVQFELVNSISELDFSRTKIAGEKNGSTLQIDTLGDGKGSATLFDQYNDFLDFRKTEYLVIDDGATHNEVFALVTDGDGSDEWANQIYVADGAEEITVDLGGIDHVFLGDGEANIVNIDLDAVLGTADSGSVSISGMAGDTLSVSGDETAKAQVESVFNAVKETADSAEISWDGMGGLSVDVYDANGDEIDISAVFTYGG